MQEIGYPSDRRAKKSNRMEWKLRDCQEPGSPMESGIGRAKPGFPGPENVVIREEGKDTPISSSIPPLNLLQFFPLTKLSHEPALTEPRNRSLQWVVSVRQAGQEKLQAGGYVMANCPRTSRKQVKIRSHIK